MPKVTSYDEMSKKTRSAKPIVGILEDEDKKRPIVNPKVPNWDKNF